MGVISNKRAKVQLFLVDPITPTMPQQGESLAVLD
jgi:hypothetical protein